MKADFSGLSFPDVPLINIIPPGPESRKYLDFQSAHESSAVSYPRGLPMAIRRARGATVEDVDGNRYIDFFGGAGVMNVGHSNRDVIQAAHKQIDEITHALDIPTPSRKSLIEALKPLLPRPLQRVFFTGPSGSDAVEAAIKLAKLNTRRHSMIAFQGSYHGMTSGALALSSGKVFKDESFPLIPGVRFVPYPYCYRCTFEKSEKTCQMACTRYLENLLEDPHSGVETPAAIIVEAIQGEGGSIVPSETFLPELRRICDKYDILMIADEVQTGFCRTGRMFAFEHSKVIPDMVTMSKALGGVGFPIACVAYKEALDTLQPGKHIGTFRGNVVAYAAGTAAIDFMNRAGLADHVKNLGHLMLSQLKKLEKESMIIGESRGKGLMLGVEFVKDKEKKTPAPEYAQKIRTLCHRKGLLIEIGGHYHNVARFLPPLILTEKLAGKGLDIFADSVREVEKGL